MQGSGWTECDLREADSRQTVFGATREFLSRARFNALRMDIEWHLGASQRWNDALVYVRSAPEPRGLAPFLRQSGRPLNFRLGEMSIASASLCRYTLFGEPLFDTDDPELAAAAALELLATLRRRLRRREVANFDGLPVDGPLHRLTTGTGVQRDFIVLQMGRPFEHQYIRLPPTYEEYLKQMGSRSRQSVLYSERKLLRESEDQVSCVCFQDCASIERFIQDATAISRKTYQWNLLDLGLQNTEGLRQRLLYAADHALLRSYILYCRDTPVSFMLGYQYLDCYYYIDVGYDPAFANLSVGSVLQLMVLKDLYARGAPPALFDFSTGYGAHKARFGNFARSEVNLLLLPRTLENRLLAQAFRWSERFSIALGSALDRLGLKQRLKKLLRQSAGKAPD